MGCLKNLTRAVFLTLVIVGGMAVINQEAIKKQITSYFNPTRDEILVRAQKIGDFSKINKEFEIEKAAGILGYNAVLAEHKASGQKMVVVDSGKKPILTKADIEAKDSEQRIKDAINKFKYQTTALDEFHVVEKGTIKSYGKTVPYAKFTARAKKLPLGEISGIISVVEDEKGNSKVLVSANESSKYSQLISNEFFKEIK